MVENKFLGWWIGRIAVTSRRSVYHCWGTTANTAVQRVAEDERRARNATRRAVQLRLRTLRQFYSRSLAVAADGVRYYGCNWITCIAPGRENHHGSHDRTYSEPARCGGERR